MRARAALVALDDQAGKVRAARNNWLKKAKLTAIDLKRAGEKQYTSGQHGPAFERFHLARTLAGKDDSWVTESRLDVLIDNVQDSIERAERDLRFAREREDEKDWPSARRTYLKLLKDFGRQEGVCDLIQDMRIPVEIVSTPPGATVFVDDVQMSATTPAYVRLSPFKGNTIRLKRAGFKDNQFRVAPLQNETDPASFRHVRTLLKAATWVRNLGGRIESAPCVWPERVAVASRNGRYQVFDSADGSEVAKGTIKTINGISAGLATDGDRFFIPTLGGNLHVFNAKTYKPETTIKGFKGLYASPVVDKGMLFVVDVDGNLFAYNTRTWAPAKRKRQLWWKKTAVGVRAAPLVHGPNVVLVTISGHVTILDKMSGDKVAEYQLRGRFSTPPVVAGKNTLIFTSEDGTLYGVETLTGGEQWRHAVTGSLRCCPEVRGRSLFLPLKEDELIEIDTRTRDEIIHTAEVDNQTAAAGTSPMYFAMGQTLVAFARRRAGGFGVAWTFEAEARITAGPVTTEGAVYIGDEKGNLYRLDAGN
jgi:outer membrane protein assembly factor BamB